MIQYTRSLFPWGPKTERHRSIYATGGSLSWEGIPQARSHSGRAFLFEVKNEEVLDVLDAFPGDRAGALTLRLSGMLVRVPASAQALAWRK